MITVKCKYQQHLLKSHSGWFPPTFYSLLLVSGATYHNDGPVVRMKSNAQPQEVIICIIEFSQFSVLWGLFKRYVHSGTSTCYKRYSGQRFTLKEDYCWVLTVSSKPLTCAWFPTKEHLRGYPPSTVIWNFISDQEMPVYPRRALESWHLIADNAERKPCTSVSSWNP